MNTRVLVLVLALLGLIKTTQSQITGIQEEEWRLLLQGEWMVKFYAPWCPACSSLQAAWQELSLKKSHLQLTGVAAVDVTESPGMSGRFMVTALPTIYHVKDGEFRQYRGSRDASSLISFVRDKKWQEIEPVSAWKHPDTVQMSLVANFFKMSMVLRNLHTLITEEYGFPSWMSYLFFALATIVIGAFLGLLLVLCIDCAYPAASSSGASMAQVVRQPCKESVKRGSSNDDDEDDDADDDDDDDNDGDSDDIPDKDDDDDEAPKLDEELINLRQRRTVRRDD